RASRSDRRIPGAKTSVGRQVGLPPAASRIMPRSLPVNVEGEIFPVDLGIFPVCANGFDRRVEALRELGVAFADGDGDPVVAAHGVALELAACAVRTVDPA